MKKKIVLIGSVVVIVVALLIGSFVFYQEHQKRYVRIRSYLMELDQAKITYEDSIGKKLQEFLENYQSFVLKTEQVKMDVLEEMYQNLEGTKEKISENLLVLQELEENVKNFDPVVMQEIFDDNYAVKVYQETKVSQTVKEKKDQIAKNSQKLEKGKEYLTYLLTNQNDWKYFDSILYYEKEEVGTVLQEYSKALELSAKVEKGVLSYTSAQIPILMYHGVSDNVWGISSLFVSPKDFEEQMKYLHDNGFTPIFMYEIEHLDPSITKPIAITFDDGNYDVYAQAYPILKKYNMKATVFVISGFGDGIYSMTHDQVKELSDSGLISIQSHTVTHKPLATLNLEEIEKELRDSKKTLEELTGKEIYTIAYPTGSYDKRVIEIAKKYYKYGLLAGGKTANINQNMSYFEIQRIGIYREGSLAFFKQACETSHR